MKSFPVQTTATIHQNRRLKKLMRRNQIIIASTVGTLAAISIGYFGVQIFGRNTMYSVSAGMFGLGAGEYLAQVVTKKRQRRRRIVLV